MLPPVPTSMAMRVNFSNEDMRLFSDILADNFEDGESTFHIKAYDISQSFGDLS